MIELRNLSVRYPGAARLALEEVTLVIDEKSFVAVMGDNGSGKSTLARTLNGLITPTSGEVIVDGIALAGSDGVRAARRKIGMVFQNPRSQITSLTVEREIAFGLQCLGLERAEIRRRVDEYLAVSGLNDVRSLPPGYLSGGQIQILAVAAVLAMRPAYVVLDESTSLLSPSSRNRLLRIVLEERNRRPMALMLITQFAEEASLAEKVLRLRAGRLAGGEHYPATAAQLTARDATASPAPARVRAGVPR